MIRWFAPPTFRLGLPSEKPELPGPVVEDGTAVERRGDRFFAGHDRVKVRFRLELGFNRANEAIETAKAVEFVPVPDLGCFKRGSQVVEGFVVRP